MMNILFLEGNVKVDFGGGQKVALDVLDALKDEYCIFGVETGHSPTYWEKVKPIFKDSLRLKIIGSLESSKSLKEIFCNLVFFPFNLIKIVSFTLKNDCSRQNTIIYSNSRYGHLYAFFLAVFGFKVIGHIHNVDRKESSFFPILKLIYNSFSKLIFVSHTARGPFLGTNSVVLYNSVPLVKPVEIKLDKEKIKVGMVGSLHKPKGIYWACKELAEMKGLEIHIAGKGPEEEVLKKIPVNLHGFQRDMNRFYAAYCDLVIIPTLIPEAFGLVAIEAISRGIPVFATAWGGQREVVESLLGEDFLFQDSEELKRLVERFQHSPEEILNQAAKARNIVLENFSEEGFSRNLRKIINEFVAEAF